MGIVTNLVGCDCLRRSIDANANETEPNNRYKYIEESNENFNDKISYPKRFANSQFIKMPNNDYFDGKIDVKDYIQKGDSLDNYQKIKCIGKGSYGSVFKVMNKNTKLIRAMKVIPKHNQKDNQEILREIEILKNLDHPNVMKIYEFLEDENNYYLIQEFCDGGDLDTILNGKKIFCEFLVKYIMYQVFLAINYLHLNNIVHQDIKKKNITIVTLGENKNEKKLKKNLSTKEILKHIVKQKTHFSTFSTPIIKNNIK